MKQISILLVAIALLIVLASCSSTNEPAGVWVNKEKIQGKSFKNIFIVVATADVEARSVIENDLAAAALERGYQVVKSIDAIPPSLQDPKPPTAEEVRNKVKETNCDAIFVFNLLKSEDSINYTKSKTTYVPTTYANWNGTFFGYYNNYYPGVSTAAYYTKDKKYFIRSNLYDAASEDIMWSVQSKIFNPSSLKEFSLIYTGSLMLKLENTTLLQKPGRGK